jgi:hypothetical protein
MRRAVGALEHLDRRVPAGDRDASLADIERLNAWFGGYWLTLRQIGHVAARALVARRLVIVDVGGGRGDFARRIERWAWRTGRQVRVIVADREGLGPPGFVRVRADATALPFREEAADVVTASLLLHHLEPAAAVRCLAEMRAAARLAVVVNDLFRSRLTLALVWLATRIFARHPFSRHDGPLSVRRAYSPDELAALADTAGLRVRIHRYRLLGRVVVVSECLPRTAAEPREGPHGAARQPRERPV